MTNSRIRLTRPAAEWKEGLPIGNGRLAAMIDGAPDNERLALNHEWLYTGEYSNRKLEQRSHHLDEIRRLFFEGKVFEAGKLANEKLGGPHHGDNHVDPYQPAGGLFIEHEHGEPTAYSRELDMDSACASVEYCAGDSGYRRMYYAHADRPIIIGQLAADEPSIAHIRFDREEDPKCKIERGVEHDSLIMTGEFQSGSRFVVVAQVRAPGAKISEAPDGRMRLEGYSHALILLTINVSHDGSDPLPEALRIIKDTPAEPKTLWESHINEWLSAWRRCGIEMRSPFDGQTAEERLERVREGEEDPGLYALYFHFGRYLLLSSSRKCDLPANLQGIWNEDINPPWNCDFHHDINLQMNYWHAENCGMEDCVEPLLRHVERFVPMGREAAKKLYGCRGVWLPIQTDCWSNPTPESRDWDVWIGAAAWLGQHFWWHYEYHQDKKFLSDRAYPYLREVALFYEDYLVRDPQGRLVPVPSQSPENKFAGGTEPVSLCVGATMDIELIQDTLTHCIEASEILGVDAKKREEWRAILSDLPPPRIGKHGQLQEWLEDYEEAEPGHRHISHLYALFPGDTITPEKTPELAKAARVSLERRLAAEGGHTGWSRAWTVACWARLREGDECHKHLKALICDFATASLLDLHPPGIFQIDGNFGGAAAIAEMLMQSHNGLIRILPALPSKWKCGAINGLLARGGFEIGIDWEDARPNAVKIRSRLGNVCRIHAEGIASAGIQTLEGRVVPCEIDGDVITFATDRNATYHIWF